MNEISTGRRAFSIVLLTIGSILLIAGGIFYYQFRGPRSWQYIGHRDYNQLLVAITCGDVGMLFLAFGYEPYLKRREEELEAGIVPDDEKYWETREFPGPHV